MPHNSANNHAIPLPPGLSSVTVLMADADRSTHALLRPLLEAGGYTVLAAETRQETLDRVYSEAPHLLLLGSRLADSTGVQVCQQIKTDSALGFFPVIILSDTDLTSQEVCAADTVIPKPVDSSELSSWMDFLLRLKWQFDGLKRENQRLVDVSRAVELLKRDIISNVSHEFRTPLVQVKAAVSLLAEDIMQNSDSDQTRVADMAMQAVARLESVVETIRQLAQAHDVRLTPVNIAESLTLAVRFMERSWTSRGAVERIEPHLTSGLPLVLADKRALARLLQLLLDNALKFSDDETPAYVLADYENEDQVWIGVQDFGIGIPAEEHQRIFETFYQVDSSSTRNYGGTGNGLALAVLLARGMNTTIKLDSAPGEGSTFSFVLPIANPNDFD